MTYQNRIEVILFNNNKKTSDKHPTETGTVEFPDGTKYQLALWNKVSKNGTPFKSGFLTLPDPKYQQQQAPKAQADYTPPTAAGVQVDF